MSPATPTSAERTSAPNALAIQVFRHPQGCRGYLIGDPRSKEALALDVHADLVQEFASAVQSGGWKLRFVVDSHTHADHPSGSRELARLTSATRVAHELSQHQGVALHPADGEALPLGATRVLVRHAPGHTPDHLLLLAGGALFCGDTLLIGGVARTDFLGGDAGQLHDSLQRLLAELPDETIVYPGHDYAGRERSTIGAERTSNPWLRLPRAEFVRALAANPPPRPANMDSLLAMNRAGVELAPQLSAAEAVRHVAAGGAGSVLDVRTGAEVSSQRVPGSRWIPLDELAARLDEVRVVPAPRLLLCQSGNRAAMAQRLLSQHHLSGVQVIAGGIQAYAAAGGGLERSAGGAISLERQVRIAAGSLVLLGVLFGAFVNPLFLGVAGFVGAGLIFAGMTDWCGMGLLLAKAPWNRRGPSGGPCGGAAACAAGAPSACAASAPSACSAGAPSACAAGAPPEDSPRASR
ncbi:MAG: DUF2892 domain-containing protein [Planctomycetes bacterium]|nr:DUF2892 domain-containing protein [Planctomycetota bacterium]